MSDGPTPVRLPAVQVDRARVRRIVAGLRPFRADGFRVETERIGDTLVVHDYGHGGSGITLSWGTARMALDHVLRTGVRDVAVLGCGAAGLTMARTLQARGMHVTIYAAAPPPKTTSSLAGAFWAPFSLLDAARLTPEIAARVALAARESHRVFSTLISDARYGIRRLPFYYLAAEPPQLSLEMSIVSELFPGTRLAPGEHPFGERHALRLDAMTIDPGSYLPTLLADFRAEGGTMVVRSFDHIAAIEGLPERVVVNCAGLGARALFGDDSMVPVKGQLVLMEPQPEIQYMLIAPAEGLYMLPRRDAVVLGTSHEHDSWSVEPTERETARILEGHRALFAGAV